MFGDDQGGHKEGWQSNSHNSTCSMHFHILNDFLLQMLQASSMAMEHVGSVSQHANTLTTQPKTMVVRILRVAE